MNAMVIKTEILIDLQQLALRMFNISQGLTLPYDVAGAQYLPSLIRLLKSMLLLTWCTSIDEYLSEFNDVLYILDTRFQREYFDVGFIVIRGVAAFDQITKILKNVGFSQVWPCHVTSQRITCLQLQAHWAIRSHWGDGQRGGRVPPLLGNEK